MIASYFACFLQLNLLLYSEQDIEEERGKISNSLSRCISIASLTSDLHSVDLGPHILNEDSSNSAGELNVLLPVLPISELGQLTVHVSNITISVDNISSLSEVVDGDSEFVDVLWKIDLNVVPNVKGGVNDPNKSSSAFSRELSGHTNNNSLQNIEGVLDSVDGISITTVNISIANEINNSLFLFANLVIEILFTGGGSKSVFVDSLKSS